MPITSETIKAAVARYWRYKRQYNLVAFECSTGLEWGWAELADIMVVNDDRRLIMVEVKTSLSDFRRDGKKRYHKHFKDGDSYLPVAQFYFAVPKDIANKVAYLCADLYPYAGVLGCDGNSEFNVEAHRGAKQLKGRKLTWRQILYLVRSQSATLCRLATKVDDQNHVRLNLYKVIEEYREKEQLWVPN